MQSNNENPLSLLQQLQKSFSTIYTTVQNPDPHLILTALESVATAISLLNGEHYYLQQVEDLRADLKTKSIKEDKKEEVPKGKGHKTLIKYGADLTNLAEKKKYVASKKRKQVQEKEESSDYSETYSDKDDNKSSYYAKKYSSRNSRKKKTTLVQDDVPELQEEKKRNKKKASRENGQVSLPFEGYCCPTCPAENVNYSPQWRHITLSKIIDETIRANLLLQVCSRLSRYHQLQEKFPITEATEITVCNSCGLRSNKGSLRYAKDQDENAGQLIDVLFEKDRELADDFTQTLEESLKEDSIPLPPPPNFNRNSTGNETASFFKPSSSKQNSQKFNSDFKESLLPPQNEIPAISKQLICTETMDSLNQTPSIDDHSNRENQHPNLFKPQKTVSNAMLISKLLNSNDENSFQNS